MPVRKIPVKEVPDLTRKGRSLLRTTDEWRDVQAILAQGLKPYEAVEVVLSEETIRMLKNATRLFAHLVKGYVRDLGLAYDIKIRNNHGINGIYIVGR